MINCVSLCVLNTATVPLFGVIDIPNDACWFHEICRWNSHLCRSNPILVGKHAISVAGSMHFFSKILSFHLGQMSSKSEFSCVFQYFQTWIALFIGQTLSESNRSPNSQFLLLTSTYSTFTSLFFVILTICRLIDDVPIKTSMYKGFSYNFPIMFPYFPKFPVVSPRFGGSPLRPGPARCCRWRPWPP